VARTHFRVTAAVGALGLGLLAMSPAVAAGGHQAGANAFSIDIAGQGAQGTGLSTASYENGHETKTGEIKPPFPQPAQDNFKLGVLVQEATAGPGGSAACAGLGGDGKGQITIGDSSCLTPGDNITGSFGDFSLSSLIKASSSAALANLPASTKTQLKPILTALGGTTLITDQIDKAIKDNQSKFGNGGLHVNLDAVEGRCTATGGEATGDATLTDASIRFDIPNQKPLTLLTLPTHPKPNTHVFTNLSDVLNMVLDAVDTQLTQGLQGNLAPGVQLTDAIRQNIVTQVHSQLEKNLAPLEQNVLDITLNWQQHPTPDSIKVRALNVDVLPAAKSSLKGNPLVNLQIGNAACAPVGSAVVSAPQASAPKVGNPKTPTGVSAGLASVPGSGVHRGLDPSTWALMALAGLGLTGAGLLGARKLFD
jgi:hypothetical protein